MIPAEELAKLQKENQVLEALVAVMEAGKMTAAEARAAVMKAEMAKQEIDLEPLTVEQMVDGLILKRRCEAAGIPWSGYTHDTEYELAEFLHRGLGLPGDGGDRHAIHGGGACPGYGNTDKVVCGITIDDLIDIAHRLKKQEGRS